MPAESIPGGEVSVWNFYLGTFIEFKSYTDVSFENQLIGFGWREETVHNYYLKSKTLQDIMITVYCPFSKNTTIFYFPHVCHIVLSEKVSK